MPLIENNTVISYKLKIKSWEAEFVKINLRKPKKEDIDNASSDIKDLYKNYWKLKKLESLNIKDDVWSTDLNKSNYKAFQTKSAKPHIKKLCDKIKQNSIFSFKEKNVPTNAKKTLLLEEFNESTSAQEVNLPESPVKLEMGDSIISSQKFDLVVDETVMKNTRKLRCVNLLPSSIGLPSKSLQFDQSLSSNWLERCSDAILDEAEKNECVKKDSSPSKLDQEKTDSNNHSKKSNNYDLNNFCGNKNAGKSGGPAFQISENSLPSNCNSPNIFANGFSPFKSCRNESSLEKDQEFPSVLENTVKDCVEQPIKKLKGQKSTAVNIYEADDSNKSLHLKRKISSGTLNENFVRLDIKKKKFSRGHKSVNIKKLKWNKWKQLKKSSGVVDQSNVTGCFKCGQFGHWAKNCTSISYSKSFENNDPFEKEDFEDVPLPTLEEAARLIKEKNNKKLGNPASGINNEVPTNNKAVQFCTFSEDNDVISKKEVEPLYEVDKNGKTIDPPEDVYEALKEMGFSNFRKGQDAAIMRVLSGLSTIVVLPTGSGKSLCYQLPAYMYGKHRKSITIVVSPLLSLMEDQVIGLPSCLHAVCLHSGMSDTQKISAMEDITEGRAQILLVSPEAVISCGFTEKFLNMPPISFVCIDEVHCLSQWSHNFRPSYLQLYKVLTQKLGVKCILGLTATATKSAIQDISAHLNLQQLEKSVVGHTNVPDNLHLSVSRDKDKDKALIKLLSGDRFSNCSSIIIYCIRRVETERLAALIRTCMQEEVETTAPGAKNKASSKKRRFIWTAEAYHAGLAPPRRRSVQKKFMTGKVRVVVATIAFGMGLDKSDIRAIIHYNMPKNFESYVQEIGRAGRDGLDAHCHLFLDNEKNDLWEQQKHIYSNGIDRYTLRKLLQKIFLTCKCLEANLKSDDNSGTINPNDNKTIACSKHEIAFSINDTVQELDVKQENISTLLCYLEFHSNKWLEILPPTYATCTIRCYGGSSQMHNIALKNPSLAAAIALDSEKGKKWQKSSNYSFKIVKVASALGCKSSNLKHDLKKLEWNEKRKTGVMVEFSDLAFHVLACGTLSDDEMDSVLEFLHQKVLQSEESQMRSLKLLFSIFHRYSSSHYWECCDEVNIEYSEEIKNAINKYFDQKEDEAEDVIKTEKDSNETDPLYVKQLIKEIICTHRDQNFTGRAIARIFHGISSPCFPSEVWGRVWKFWRCLLPVNFNVIMKMANEELRALK